MSYGKTVASFTLKPQPCFCGCGGTALWGKPGAHYLPGHAPHERPAAPARPAPARQQAGAVPPAPAEAAPQGDLFGPPPSAQRWRPARKRLTA